MPLPFIVGAAIAGAVGVGSGIKGASKMKEANDTIKYVKKKHEENIKIYEKQLKLTNETMDSLGKLQLEILSTFGKFSDKIDKIINKPKFESYSRNGVDIPRYDGEKLKKVSICADAIKGALSGASLGIAGGFAASGATTAVVMAVGTASTGTAISSLSGIALTNATLAALGGGSIATGGAGIAGGTALLGATTLGVGLLVGGIVFNFTGSKLSDKASEANTQMLKAQKEINKIYRYLFGLQELAEKYYSSLSYVKQKYDNYLNKFINIKSTDWNYFTDEEKETTETTILFVGLLYNMCKVELVIKAEKESDINSINTKGVNESICNANKVIS